MLYKITAVEEKNKDWKMISGSGVDGTTLTNASVNRTSQKGEVFPNFDGITVGAEVEGEPWSNQSGKQYLFAPREKKAGGARRGVDPLAIAKAQEHKAENIRAAQDNKQEGIKVSSTARDATLILNTIFATLEPRDQIDWKDKWLEIRQWLWDNFDHEVTNASDVPF